MASTMTATGSMEATRFEKPGELKISASPTSTACSTLDLLVEFRSVSGSEGSSDGGTEVPVQEVERCIQGCLREASDSVGDFAEADLRLVKTLQRAERNQGCVDLMEDLAGGQFAVKKMPTAWITKSHEEFCETHGNFGERPWFDVATVKYLQSKGFTYLCRHIGIFRDDLNTYVVSDLASEGDAFTWCTRGPSPCPAREGAVSPVFRQLCSATAWLHDLGIAHQDISLENVLLHKDPETGAMHVKLIDFGMATAERYTNHVCGKPSYQAPEMHVEEGHLYDGFRADVFALGVCLFALALKDYPWMSTKPGQCKKFEAYYALGLRDYLLRRKAPRSQSPMISVLSTDLLELLEGLLDTNPQQRVTLGESCWEAPADADGAEPVRVWDMSWMVMWQ